MRWKKVEKVLVAQSETQNLCILFENHPIHVSALYLNLITVLRGIKIRQNLKAWPRGHTGDKTNDVYFDA